MKIALVHDYLVQYGGAERVLEALCEIWPWAPIYTLIHDPDSVHHRFDKKTVRTSFLQNIPFSKKHHRIFPPIMTLAVEQFDFSYYDVVLSDSSSFAKNIITGPDTLHICYCHTPMRYGWDDCQQYTEEFSFPAAVRKIITPFFMNYIRMFDFFGSHGVDYFIANSKFVSGRIKKYYHRDSAVINPPVDLESFYVKKEEEIGDYFLLTGRMMKYKKMDLVIEVFNELKLPLKIIGRGVEFDNLKKIAAPNVEFLGRVSEEKLRQTYSRAKALIFPQEEDFGIVAIEALSSGRPIIAYKAGDIPEHVTDGKSAVFFDKQTKAAIIDAVNRFNRLEFDPEFIRNSVFKFDKKNFKDKIKNFVEEKWENFKTTS